MAESNENSLQEKLSEAESIIDALRAGEVDAVVGEQQVLLLRLREAEDALRRSEARYRAIVEDQFDLVCRWDPQGRLTFVNEAFCRFFGRHCDDLLHEPVDDLLPIEAGHAHVLRELTACGADQPLVDHEHHVDAPAGETAWLHVTHRMIYDKQGQPAEVQSVAREITARKRAEEQLQVAIAELEQRVQERTAQLRALVRDLDQAEQRERRRLAQFLHDDLQQLLVATRFSLEGLRHAVTTDRHREALDQARGRIDRSIAASRSLASQLSPPVLQTEGLVPALRWLADQMREMHDLPVHVEADPQVEPRTEHVRDLLFALARELLLNVVKHAKADQCWLHLRRRSEDLIELEVRDDGAGFDAADWSPARQSDGGFGLWSIDERLQLLGGSMHLDSAPGRGCRVTLVAPISTAAN